MGSHGTTRPNQPEIRSLPDLSCCMLVSQVPRVGIAMQPVQLERKLVLGTKPKIVAWAFAGAAAVALIAALPLGSPAHETPADVTVQAFLKPEGERMRLLLRVPLTAMQEVTFPTSGPGYLVIDQADSALRDAAMLWVGQPLQLYEGDRPLGTPEIAAIMVSIPSDRSFREYDDALAHVTGPSLPDDTALIWQQALLDILFEYPIRSEASEFSIRPGLERLASRVVMVLRFLPPSGVIRAFRYIGDPGLVRLDPRWHQAALQFVKSGFLHILDGFDHLLFLFCLVIPFRRLGPLVKIVTAFTVAHSVTLIASAYGLAPGGLWFPPLVETLIAASIVYMALENVTGANAQRRWLLTFGFGLIHGFGFSFALRESLQFAGSHLLTSLLSFNIGVELGQLLVLLLLIPSLDFLFRFVVAERMGTIILSVLVGHTGWHWMTERWGIFRQYQIRWPALSGELIATTLGLALLTLVVGGLSWWVFGTLWKPGERVAPNEAVSALDD